MELSTPTPLLDNRTLNAPGWARHPYWKYDRKKAGISIALREWDSYSITDEEGGFSFSIVCSDMGYAGIYSIAFIDFRCGKVTEVHGVKLFPKSRILSEDPEADSAVTYADSNMTIAIVRKGLKHQILITAPYLTLPDGSGGLKADMVLYGKEGMESMCTALPADESGRFWCYGMKTGPMPAEGVVFINHRPYRLSEGRSYGTLDWERGRWPMKCGWTEASASGVSEEGNAWGLSLSSGYSGSCIFSDSRISRLGNAAFTHQAKSGIWRIEDQEGRIGLSASPLAELDSTIDLWMMKAGRKLIGAEFSGFITLESGRRIGIDKAYGTITGTKIRW